MQDKQLYSNKIVQRPPVLLRYPYSHRQVRYTEFPIKEELEHIHQLQCSHSFPSLFQNHLPSSTESLLTSAHPTFPLPRSSILSLMRCLEYYLQRLLSPGVRSGSVRIPFRLRSGQFRTKIFAAKDVISKHFQFVRPSPPRRGPSSGRPEPRRPKGPGRGGDGRTNNLFFDFCKFPPGILFLKRTCP